MDIAGEYRIAAPRGGRLGGAQRSGRARPLHPRLQGAGAGLAGGDDGQGRPEDRAGLGGLYGHGSPGGRPRPRRATASSGRATAAWPASPRAAPRSTLAAEGGETVLAYTAKAEVGGKIATLGGRLMQATSRKLADEFFGKFAAEFGVTRDPAAPTPAEA